MRDCEQTSILTYTLGGRSEGDWHRYANPGSRSTFNYRCPSMYILYIGCVFGV